MRTAARTRAIHHAAGGSAFDPATIPGYFDEWVADDIAGVDGDPIGSWTGRGGHTFTQATGTKKPLLKTNIVSGKSVLRFDGTDDFMSLSGVTVPGVANPSDLSIVVVTKYVTGTGGIISSRDGGSTGWLFRVSSTAATLFAHTGASPNVTDAFTTTNWNIIELVRSALSAKFGHNGTMPGSGTAISAYPGATTRIVIGGEVNGASGSDPATNFLSGDIARILLIAGAMSDPDRDNLETLYGSAYGITVV